MISHNETQDFVLEKACLLAPAIRMMVNSEINIIVCHFYNNEIDTVIKTAETFSVAMAKSCIKNALYIHFSDDIEQIYVTLQKAISEFVQSKGNAPDIVAVQNIGLFCRAVTKHQAHSLVESFFAQSKTVLNNDDKKPAEKRLSGKIVVVTGSAQGFGKGIAQSLAKEGAHVVIADVNTSSARECAREIETECGAGYALPLGVDVTDEESVKKLMQETILAFGGMDVFISNAGILKAGSLDELDLASFELVTKINYTAFFLCTKYASAFMKLQHRFNQNYYSDIIQINSKSGLEGSNKNFAYAGGKFGGIGLTQSFALELVEYNIKVNAVCPGNFFEGPLWSDPKTGLFAQYLKTNKVTGAKTIDDVRLSYVNKVPMKRGCRIQDVVTAVLYLIEQQYETGQALPVTGGQVMLR